MSSDYHTITVTAESFMFLGFDICSSSSQSCEEDQTKRFISHFGTTAQIVSLLWNFIRFQMPKNANPFHLQWGLFFLTVFLTDTVCQSIFGCHEKTTRKWISLTIKSLARINSVSLRSI